MWRNAVQFVQLLTCWRPPVLQVSVLLLKVRSVCVGMEVLGESTAVALEVAQVTPNQLGNVCLRQYLSSRSLGKSSAAKNAIKVTIKQASRAAVERVEMLCAFGIRSFFFSLVFFDSSSWLNSKKLKHICTNLTSAGPSFIVEVKFWKPSAINEVRPFNFSKGRR